MKPGFCPAADLEARVVVQTAMLFLTLILLLCLVMLSPVRPWRWGSDPSPLGDPSSTRALNTELLEVPNH